MIGKAFTVTATALLLFAAVPAEMRGQVEGSLTDQWVSGTLVVVSGGAAEALLIDPATRRLLARFPTGPDPREVALSPDGRFAYVTSFGWVAGRVAPTAGAEGAAYGAGEALAGGPGGVTVLDLMQRRVHAVFHPGEYRNLEAIRVADDGNRLWMASADGGIVELDAHTGEVKMLWQSGGVDPGTLTVSGDTRRIYVANTDSDHVTMIDRVTVVPTDVPTGRGPEGLALSSDQRELWVANSGDHTISVIGTRRLDTEATFPSGGIEPTRLEFHPGGYEVWVSHRGSRDVTVLDVASAAVLATVPIDGEPRALTFSEDGSQVFVSVPERHRVYVIDVASREVMGSLEAGQLPAGVAFSGEGRGGRRSER